MEAPSNNIQVLYNLNAYDALNNEIIPAEDLIQKIDRNPPLKNQFRTIQTTLISACLQNIDVTLIPSFVDHQYNTRDSNSFTLTFECTDSKPYLVKLEFRLSRQLPSPHVVTKISNLSLNIFLRRFTLDLSNELFSHDESFIKKSPSVYGCHNVFYSGIYRSYLFELKNFIFNKRDKFSLLIHPDNSLKQGFQNLAISLVRLILEIDLDKPELFNDAHKNLVIFFREILPHKNDIDSNPIQSQIRLLINDLTEWIYTGPNLVEDGWNLLVGFIPTLKNIENWNLTPILHRLYNLLIAHPQMTYSITESNSDLFLYGYLAYSLWKGSDCIDKEMMRTHFIRSPNVTFRKDYGTNLFGYNVTENFKHFIYQCHEAGKTILYLNFMATKNHFPLTGMYEGLMSSAIHHLESNSSMPNITIISLDRNSDFYFCKKGYSSLAYPELDQASSFKLKFLYHLFDQDGQSPCIWARTMDTEIFRGRFRYLIDQIHIHYFKGSDYLTDKHRLVFQEMFYLFFAYTYIRDRNFDFCIPACQATADRAPSFYTALRLLHFLSTQDGLTQDDVKELLSMLLMNAILTENRPPCARRVAIFIEVTTLLLSKPVLKLSPLFKQEKI